MIMRDAFLITDSTFEISDFRLYTMEVFEFEEVDEFEIEYNIPYEHESYFSISKDNSMFDLMEPDEQKIIISEFDKFNVFACLFYNFHYLQKLVASFPSSRKILIDNDHGRIMKRDEFLKLNSHEEFVKEF